MTMPTDDDDAAGPKGPKVKDLLSGGASLDDVVDAAARAELEKWFGLPSFTELAEKGEVIEDPHVARIREQRALAIAAVDPAMLEAHRRRVEVELLPARPEVAVKVKPTLALIDLERIEAMHVAIAEPRVIDLPPQLEDDLKECTPQALLRDLHRPETTFDFMFEVVDVAAQARFDLPAEVKWAMTTSWKLPPAGIPPWTEALVEIGEARRLRRIAPTEIRMPNRRVKD